MTTSVPKRLLLTPGEPAGVGPELCLTIAMASWPCELVAIADPKLLTYYQQLLGLDVKVQEVTLAELNNPPQIHQPGILKCLPVSLAEPATAQQLNAANGKYVVETLDLASELMLQAKADALVTAPVHKGIINDAGIAFTGHTEFLAAKANINDVVMLLAHDQLRVALVTTHLPLRNVADAITPERLEKVLRICEQDLKTKFHIKQPVMHVCGLNPHAGEDGHLGTEEIQIISPVLEKLRAQGMQIKGPLPADTALTLKGVQGADINIAMYHDQGLPVLKYAGFGKAVNITLGLPFIRVSVDHGTALDIAGQGTVDKGSMISAMEQALVMSGATLNFDASINADASLAKGSN
jgi:4-hydroxythreonine-4-phosphate dehydrogenase